ncbi:hypothetical protein RSSM_04003 [Rhodopirellula sallentina SM41]|uniref:Uncharacterized protein n=1 Tax=Rhodopirellula sallentina SM41 TaxID=1263870 RepID=M5TZ92_9BACT|nr:hypothetical protein RSSM_04003 [Rhodopirellula sallentina SM41]
MWSRALQMPLQPLSHSYHTARHIALKKGPVSKTPASPVICPTSLPILIDDCHEDRASANAGPAV